MEENININEEELNEDGVPRPAPDPKNKLYTVICLLIFAVLYFGWSFIKDNVTLSYSYYLDSFTDDSRSRVLSEMGISELPDGAELRYARLNRIPGDSSFYAAVSISADFAESEEFPSGLISYRYGDVVCDSRYTVYPEADTKADYVYGDGYVSIENPREYFVIYEDDGGYTAVFRTDDFSRETENIFKGCEKLPFENDRLR